MGWFGVRKQQGPKCNVKIAGLWSGGAGDRTIAYWSTDVPNMGATCTVWNVQRGPYLSILNIDLFFNSAKLGQRRPWNEFPITIKHRTPRIRVQHNCAPVGGSRWFIFKTVDRNQTSEKWWLKTKSLGVIHANSTLDLSPPFHPGWRLDRSLRA